MIFVLVFHIQASSLRFDIFPYGLLFDISFLAIQKKYSGYTHTIHLCAPPGYPVYLRRIGHQKTIAFNLISSAHVQSASVRSWQVTGHPRTLPKAPVKTWADHDIGDLPNSSIACLAADQLFHAACLLLSLDRQPIFVLALPART